MKVSVLTAIVMTWWCAGTLVFAQGVGARSPHDGQHLVAAGPGQFQRDDGQPVALVPDPGAKWSGKAIDVSHPASVIVRIQHAGTYAVWVRVGTNKGAPAAISVSIKQPSADSLAPRSVLDSIVGSDRGSAKVGGPIGFEAFAKLVNQSGPSRDVKVKADSKGSKSDPQKDSDDLGDLLKELDTKKGASESQWANFLRQEEQNDARPYFWWKAGTVELRSGEATLHVSAAKAKPGTVFLDGAFLSTNTTLAYPFIGDVNAPPASYIRFRLGDVRRDQANTAKGAAKAGSEERADDDPVSISAAMRIHSDPWSTARVWLNPDKIGGMQPVPHTEPGFTRWYRLQEIENAPAFGASEAHLLLSVQSVSDAVNRRRSSAAVPPRGATQFAVFPHDDYVLREIDWSEPEGLNITLVTDFSTHLHRLRTLRDHAREHYEMALRATDGKLYPLTRGDLYFGNAWGAASGDCAGYMNQTFRLLGFNSVGASHEAIKYRDIYGWTSSAGHYWPEVHLPFDAASTRKQYDDYYSKYFGEKSDYFRGVSTFQIADEPGEISRVEMTSPLWRLERDDLGEKYVDASGNSDLHSRRCDYEDCVLEGRLEAHGTMLGFRVGLDQTHQPKQFAYWHVGAVSINREMNVAMGREGKAAELAKRPAARLLKTPMPFKIVYDGKSAALFLNGQLVGQHSNVPPRGGFGFTGGAKAIRSLSVRPLQAKERLGTSVDEVASKKKVDLLDDLGLGGGSETKESAKTASLEQTIRDAWVSTGGMQEAHLAFRAWCRDEMKLEPTLFGQTTWDNVSLLTVPSFVRTAEEARLFYWSRRFSGMLTPKMFNLAADAIHAQAPNKEMRGFVALSGHSLYFPSEQPLDTFQLADGDAMTPGISDWMSLGGWFWDSHQAVAFSMAPFNAGARRPGQMPRSFPMMHCVGPSTFRAYTMLANQARYISFYNFGPSYAVTEGYWSEAAGCYDAVNLTANRAAQVDDVLTQSRLRPSRVALLYSMSNEYWHAQSSFADKRAAFLALSHEYFQPELVTEDQVAADSLRNYDALFVLDPLVRLDAQQRIAEWVNKGGLLWTCADALTRNEFNEPADWLDQHAQVTRGFTETNRDVQVSPIGNAATFRTHAVVLGKTGGKSALPKPATEMNALPNFKSLPAGATVRARYVTDEANAEAPAWIEWKLGQGRIVYVGHRAGLTYSRHKVRLAGQHTIWSDSGRALLVQPLLDAGVDRELNLSEPAVMAGALSSETGTVILLHDMAQGSRRDLKITLKEAARPHSVEVFSGLELKPLPFEFSDGRVTFMLPELDDGQMIVVRRSPPPADKRLDQWLSHTRTLLKSDDPTAIAGGAWFAGRFPQWNLAESLTPLLKHSHWEVRRAAAESLGRLRPESAAPALVAALSEELDPHVLGDLLVAIAEIDASKGERLTLVRKFADGRSPFVRQQALRALSIYGRSGHRLGETTDWLNEPLADADLRVRREAIRLHVLSAPVKSVDLVDSAHTRGASLRDQEEWHAAIASDPAAWDAAVTRTTLSPQFVLSLAQQKADPRIATHLIHQVTASQTANTNTLLAADAIRTLRAASRQRDQRLTRQIFSVRSQLSREAMTQLPVTLELTFGQRLGHDLAAWDEWLNRSAETRAAR